MSLPPFFLVILWFNSCIGGALNLGLGLGFIARARERVLAFFFVNS